VKRETGALEQPLVLAQIALACVAVRTVCSSSPQAANDSPSRCSAKSRSDPVALESRWAPISVSETRPSSSMSTSPTPANPRTSQGIMSGWALVKKLGSRTVLGPSASNSASQTHLDQARP
jgi:hypothetical protein